MKNINTITNTLLNQQALVQSVGDKNNHREDGLLSASNKIKRIYYCYDNSPDPHLILLKPINGNVDYTYSEIDFCNGIIYEFIANCDNPTSDIFVKIFQLSDQTGLTKDSEPYPLLGLDSELLKSGDITKGMTVKIIFLQNNFYLLNSKLAQDSHEIGDIVSTKSSKLKYGWELFVDKHSISYNLFQQSRPAFGQIRATVSNFSGQINNGWVEIARVRGKYIRTENGDSLKIDDNFLIKATGLLAQSDTTAHVGQTNFATNNHGMLKRENLPKVELDATHSHSELYAPTFQNQTGDGQYGFIAASGTENIGSKTISTGKTGVANIKLQLNSASQQAYHDTLPLSYVNYEIYTGSLTNISDDANILPALENLKDALYQQTLSVVDVKMIIKVKNRYHQDLDIMNFFKNKGADLKKIDID